MGTIGSDDDGAFVGGAVVAVNRRGGGGGGDGTDALVGVEVCRLDGVREGVVEDFREVVAAYCAEGDAVAACLGFPLGLGTFFCFLPGSREGARDEGRDGRSTRGGAGGEKSGKLVLFFDALRNIEVA